MLETSDNPRPDISVLPHGRVANGRPLILGLGGTVRPNSSTEMALRSSLNAARNAGADTLILAGADLDLPHYSPASSARTDRAIRLVRLIGQCDGIIIASPGYHGSISGLIKNALDYTEDLRDGPRVYFDGIAVGCIACSYGWQAAASTLAALRSITHALRGWPTPLGVAINSSEAGFDQSGACVNPAVESQLAMMALQVVQFAKMRANMSMVQSAEAPSSAPAI
jgi:FMN reductase